MMLLKIGFGTVSSEMVEPSTRQIIFGHFRFHNITVEQAQKGFRRSPGIVIVMPRLEEESFSVDGQLVAVPAGAALVLNGESHNILLRSNESEGDVDSSGSLGVIEVNATVNDSFRLRDALKFPLWLSSHDSAEVADIYHDLIFSDHAAQSLSDDSNMSVHLAAARIASLLLNTSGHFPAEPTRGKSAAQLDRLRRYLLANIGNKITTADMAAHIGLTQTHFCSRAKSLLGETPMSYLRRIRLERSMELLEHSDESVDAIASQVGYGDRFSFSKEFKRHFEVSPVQYRKRSGTALQDEAYLKAKMLFDSSRHEQALSLCERVLRKTDSGAGLDPFIYLQGRCLFALGRSEEALAAWTLLEAGDYAWQAGIRCCQLYFHNNHHGDALGELCKLWERADGLKHNDVIQTWVEQVSAMLTTRRPQYLRRYLDFRKERFVTDQQSKTVALQACRCVGNTMLILQHCLDDDTRRLRALRGAGEYEQALTVYGSKLDQNDLARIYLESGQFDKVLALKPESPKYSAIALVQLGRPEEAVERFPDDSVDAYLTLGRYQEALDHVPNVRAQRVYALHALGRKDELQTVGRAGEWFWHIAHLYLSPETLLKVDYPQTHLFVPAATMLLAFQHGCTTEDTLNHVSGLKRIDSNDFWALGQGSTIILLRHVVPALLGDREVLENASAAILAKWRYYDRQRLYHDVAYLVDAIDLDTWHRQPFQEDLAMRGRFIQSLRYDLKGKANNALKGYMDYIGRSPIYGFEKLFRYRFAEWRIESLATRS